MTTGALSGTPTTSGTYNMTVQVSDSAGSSATATLAILIASCTSCSPLTITTTNIPDGTVGMSFAATLAGAGGTPPYTWSISSGALPTGVTLVSSGMISGIPTAAGTYRFTTQLTDSASPATTTSAALALTVGHTVSLSWAASTTSNVVYNVYRGITPGGPYMKLTPSALGTVSFIDSSVSPGQTYFYVTTAVNSSGESGYSNEAQAAVPFP